MRALVRSSLVDDTLNVGEELPLRVALEPEQIGALIRNHPACGRALTRPWCGGAVVVV